MAFRLARCLSKIRFSAPSLWPVPSTRLFAKGKGGRREKITNRDPNPELLPPEFDFDNLRSEMEATMEWLHNQLEKVKLGRGDPRVFDNVTVHSKKTILSNIAQIIPRSANELLVKPFDSKDLDDVLTALSASDLNVTARKDAQGLVQVTIPKPTQELRNELIKQVKNYGEQAKNSVRRHRQSGIKMIKDMKELSKDENRDWQNEVQKVHDEFVKKIEELTKSKETSINS